MDDEGNAIFNHYGGTSFKYSEEMDQAVFTDRNGKQVYYYTDFSWGTLEDNWFARELKVFPYNDLNVIDQINDGDSGDQDFSDHTSPTSTSTDWVWVK